MVFCVVPYCKSDTRKEKISFHEITNHCDLRQKWLRAISRQEDYSAIFLNFSHFGDPRYAYHFLFPVSYIFNQQISIELLWTASVAEWLNHILKWMLDEDRPYWWIMENECGNITVQQFAVTCETGPGSPSGHVMVTAAVWFVTLNGLLSCYRLKTVALLLWMLYTLLLLFISIARVLIAAHFPHQCLLGFILGLFLGIVVNKYPVKKPKYFCGASIFLIAFTFAVYGILQKGILDPNRSLNLAKKWCAKPDYLYIDTTPFFCLMRYSGAVMGLGVSLFIANTLKLGDVFTKLNICFKLCISFSAAVLVHLTFLLDLPVLNSSNYFIYFYNLVFIRYCFIPLKVIVLVPCITKVFSQVLQRLNNSQKMEKSD